MHPSDLNSKELINNIISPYKPLIFLIDRVVPENHLQEKSVQMAWPYLLAMHVNDQSHICLGWKEIDILYIHFLFLKDGHLIYIFFQVIMRAVFSPESCNFKVLRN